MEASAAAPRETPRRYAPSVQPAYVTSIILASTLAGFAVSVWSETSVEAVPGARESREIALSAAPISPALDWGRSLEEALEAYADSLRPVLVYVRPAPSEARVLEAELAADPRMVERLGEFELVCADLWSADAAGARAAGAVLNTLDLHTAPHLVVVDTSADDEPVIVDAVCPLIGARFGAPGVCAELARLEYDPGADPETPLRAVRRLRAAGRFHDAAERFGEALAEERSEVGPLHRTAALVELQAAGTPGDELERALRAVLEKESDREVLFRGWGLVVRSIEDRVLRAEDADARRRLLRELRTASRKLYQAAPEDRLLPVLETLLDWFRRDEDDLDSLDRIFVRNLETRAAALDPDSPVLAPR